MLSKASGSVNAKLTLGPSMLTPNESGTYSGGVASAMNVDTRIAAELGTLSRLFGGSATSLSMFCPKDRNVELTSLAMALSRLMLKTSSTLREMLRSAESSAGETAASCKEICVRFAAGALTTSLKLRLSTPESRSSADDTSSGRVESGVNTDTDSPLGVSVGSTTLGLAAVSRKNPHSIATPQLAALTHSVGSAWTRIKSAADSATSTD
eukprot:scaffold63_cov306-Pinguiococcus_pyrenoidosus.AAC.54